MRKRSKSREEASQRGAGAESPVEMEATGGRAAGRSFMGTPVGVPLLGTRENLERIALAVFPTGKAPFFLSCREQFRVEQTQLQHRKDASFQCRTCLYSSTQLRSTQVSSGQTRARHQGRTGTR